MIGDSKVKTIKKYVLFSFIISFFLINASYSFLGIKEKGKLKNKFELNLKQIIEYDKTNNEFLLIMNDLKKEIVTYNFDNNDQIKNYYKKVFDKLSNFIKKYPDSKSSLTAKLLIGVFTIKASTEEVCFPEMKSDYLFHGIKVCKELYDKNSNCWQKIFAGFSAYDLFFKSPSSLETIKKQIVICQQFLSLIKIKDFSNDPEFKIFRYFLSDANPNIYKEPFEISLYSELGYLFEKVGNRPKAIEYFSKCLEFSETSYNCIGIKSKLKRLKREMK